MRIQHCLAAGAMALAMVLTGCGSDGSPSADGPATVTITPTVTATPKPSGTAKPANTDLKSDVLGRAYDFGTVLKVSTKDGTEVIEFDRWTIKGLDDAKLAKDGRPVAPYKGKPFLNQNDDINFTIPVDPDATVLWHHCASASEPIQTKSASMEEMSKLGERENKLMVKLDERGYLVNAQNYASC